MNIDDRHRKAAKLLARNCSYRSTAAALGVDHKTVTRWRDDEDFQKLVEAERVELYGSRPSMTTPLVVKAGEALSVLIDRVASPQVSVEDLRGLEAMVKTYAELVRVESEDQRNPALQDPTKRRANAATPGSIQALDNLMSVEEDGGD